MNVTEMVALIEQRLPPSGGFEMIQLSDYELRALIASWRERGDALNAIVEELEHARAALKGEP